MSLAQAIRDVSCERGFVIRVAAASVGMPVARMPARGSLTLLADVPDGQRRNGGPELVMKEMLETLKIAGHVAIDERDPHARVHRNSLFSQPAGGWRGHKSGCVLRRFSEKPQA